MIEVLVGIAAGLLIGATGIGAGSLLAPLLILAGYSPATAVGAGLVSLVLSKLTAAELHRQLGHLPTRDALPLISGGLAGVGLTWLGTRAIGQWDLLAAIRLDAVIKGLLGTGLLVLAVTLVVPRKQTASMPRARGLLGHPVLLFAIGMVVAVVVALSSAGSGSLLIPALLVATRWEPAELAAVTNFYGFTTGLASLGVYLVHHSLNFQLVGLVLMGLLPGVVLGTRLSRLIPRPLLARGAGLIVGYLGCALLLSTS